MNGSVSARLTKLQMSQHPAADQGTRRRGGPRCIKGASDKPLEERSENLYVSRTFQRWSDSCWSRTELAPLAPACRQAFTTARFCPQVLTARFPSWWNRGDWPPCFSLGKVDARRLLIRRHHRPGFSGHGPFHI